ncbi:putative phage tail fiber assembly protein [Escherichia coli]|uniref:Putative phage tail fiber assembly protein n=1 Tax=Escherichia coli TaxID=562 RepID=A0A2X1N819_ECOLX|nr:putative phage tail fiber assembly protein [Escherichia coli]
MNDIYAVVDNNVVINVIIWDGISEWKPEAGNLVPLNGDAGIGLVIFRRSIYRATSPRTLSQRVSCGG